MKQDCTQNDDITLNLTHILHFVYNIQLGP